jgi:uncharacterized protein (TIGR02996 family)
MPDDLAFLQALIASPNDNDLRKVYADWLEDSGDPRAPFLRLEVALHESDPGAGATELREMLHQARRGLDTRWVGLVERSLVGWRIVRTQPIRRTYGKAIPAFIHNFYYHLSAVNAYGDGAIDCWGFVDLSLFRQKLASGWVVPQAEVGDVVTINNLGQARVLAAEWHLTPADVESQVIDAVRELNPTLEGLLDMHGTDTEVRDGRRYAKLCLGNERPYRISLAGDQTPGAELPVFEVTAEGYQLRHWFVYADGLTQLGYGNELLPLEAVAQMFEDGRLTLSVPVGSWVTLDGLGRFQAGEGFWFVEPKERVREAFGLLEEANGQPGLILRCVEAHRAYEEEPGEERREALRLAYEAVPKHRRVFCGDMDSKDVPIRRILYGDEDEDDVADE